MAVNQLNSTTLTNAIVSSDNLLVLNSTSNISVGSLIVIRREAMKVQEIPIAGQVKVLRGYDSTRAVAHPAASLVYIGTPDQFLANNAALAESFESIAGDPGVLPNYMLPGQRARDGSGREYILVDLQATVYTGVTVLIDSAHDGTYFAAVLTSGSQGSVGVMAEEGTSAQYAWAQVYGYCAGVMDSTATSAADSTYLPTAASSVSTPAAGMAAIAYTSGVANTFLITGMFLCAAATSATTSATSTTGISIPAWLNYPYVKSIQDTVNS